MKSLLALAALGAFAGNAAQSMQNHFMPKLHEQPSRSFGRSKCRIAGKKQPAGSKLARMAKENRVGLRHVTQYGLTLKAHFDSKRRQAAR